MRYLGSLLVWGVEFTKDGTVRSLLADTAANALTEACQRLLIQSNKNKALADECLLRMENLHSDVENLTDIIEEFKSFLKQFEDPSAQ